MRIAWITIDSLMPLNTAGRIGIYKRLEKLWDENEVFLFYFYSLDSEKNASDVLKNKCKAVYAYKRNSKSFMVAMELLKGKPYTVATRINNSFIQDFKECIKACKIDLINIDFPQMCYPLMNEDINLPIVLNQHNIEWQRFEEIASSKSISPLRKLISKRESVSLRKFEEKLYKLNRITGMTFVTPDDMAYFKKWQPESNAELTVIPGGAEKREYSPLVNNHNLVFVGVMSNELNPEGAIWFVKNIFPKIKKQIPDSKFYIVGKDPIPALTQMSSNDIIVTGCVDDLSKYYKNTNLVVIPILHGGGVKLKLLEAIGYGKYVVTTSVGAHGTDFVNGQDLYIDDDPDMFAEHCIEILNNPEKYKFMLENEKAKFDRKYTWQAVYRRYSKFLKKIFESFQGN